MNEIDTKEVTPPNKAEIGPFEPVEAKNAPSDTPDNAAGMSAEEAAELLEDMAECLSREDFDNGPAICNQGEAFKLGARVAQTCLERGRAAAEDKFFEGIDMADLSISDLYARRLLALELELAGGKPRAGRTLDDVRRRVAELHADGVKMDWAEVQDKYQQLAGFVARLTAEGQPGPRLAPTARQLARLADLLES